VLAVNVLRRLRRTRRDRHVDEPQSVAGMRTILDDAGANRPAAGLLSLAGTYDLNAHYSASC